MTASLRAATTEDAPTLAILHETCFGGMDAYVQPWNEDDFREFLEFSNYCGRDPFLVAEKDGQIAGFLMAQFDADKPFKATVKSIDVDPRYRNEGIASLMLTALEEHIRTKRQFAFDTEVVAEINATNQPSQRLFSSFDYAASGVEADYYAPGVDALIVKKTIPASPPARLTSR